MSDDKCRLCGEPKPENIDHLWACCGDGPGYGDFIKPETLACAKRRLAATEQRAFERGREAGAAPFAALFEAGYVLDTTMPTEADGYATRSLHVGLKTGRGGTWLDAARDLCAKLGLNLAKDGE